MPEVSKTKPWILPEDEEEAERTFNDLPVQQQLEFVLHYHGRRDFGTSFSPINPRSLSKGFPKSNFS
jgi:hypothetical protein